LSIQSATERDAGTPFALGAVPVRHDGAAEVVRRALEVVVSASMLVVLSPVIAAIAISIRATSRGPAIFRQERLGQGGRPFVFYKFRGMYVDARERWPELYEYSYAPEEIHTLRFHPEQDPRVTPVGRFLRRTSLDEVLNFYNVLKGDMSLVGVRPEIPEMIPYYGEHAQTILAVKPGITSLAKVTGRDELTFGETLELDVEYVRRRSLRLDLRIIAATVMTVVLQHGVLPG
jgi:lipopolysaccharide/colanic/teichoic acid biosynthesis glycosyltransferase